MQKLRQFENVHIALWLMKDTFWVMDLHLLGVIMIVPTLTLAIYISWRSRHDRCELLHNIAVSLWICANTTWMVGEFFYNDSFRPYATVFFFAGLGVILYYYLFLYRPRKILIENAET